MTFALVTGGSGFIGQHLVSELVARGRQVRVIDVLLPTRVLPAVDYVEGSVLDKGRVHAAMAGVEEVYHLAGLPGMWKRDRADFHAVNFIGTENVLAAARQHGVARFMHCSTESILFGASQPADSAAEDASLTVDGMPGPYTRSKMLADKLALQAAASGFPVVVGCPTMPIGPHDHNLTPPTAMLQHFLGDGRFQLYLDFIVNLVDVRDVALGLILAMEKGRVGHRYLLGGDCVRLGQILALMAATSGRRKLFVPVPGRLAELAAWVLEFKADYVTGRVPSATVEGVRIARRATALPIDKARRELGYTPRPVEPVLRETIAHMMGVPVGRILKHA
ncbi:NAD-dependent epimerase/dehydratase family protein [Bradyrhizobium canariense]|uniref:Dihydroflavonol-4-reductase n=1 Tax=Bradyrhizobium canariense TaxID=255045 RepID=A0A1H1UI34_9BRAD|nr:NAD-dependent epimerase/dehydratase family protein [Bradyrhizobium canariense]SDS72172.1 dihydroflavonol-4-reductase [Bradyrhizobium canariense]